MVLAVESSEYVFYHKNENDLLQGRLKPLYKKYKEKKYTVAVYYSGKDDLSELTRDLLIYNKRRIACHNKSRIMKHPSGKNNPEGERMKGVIVARWTKVPLF